MRHPRSGWHTRATPTVARRRPGPTDSSSPARHDMTQVGLRLGPRSLPVARRHRGHWPQWQAAPAGSTGPGMPGPLPVSCARARAWARAWPGSTGRGVERAPGPPLRLACGRLPVTPRAHWHGRPAGERMTRRPHAAAVTEWPQPAAKSQRTSRTGPRRDSGPGSSQQLHPARLGGSPCSRRRCQWAPHSS